MEFCKNCDNMCYMKINDEKKLIYFCKYCGFEDSETIQTQDLKVLKFSKENKNKDIHINEYTKYDPTLPHMNTIKCPNVECVSNTKPNVQQDVVYLRYDDKNMKYMYLCCNCDFNWVP